MQSSRRPLIVVLSLVAMLAVGLGGWRYLHQRHSEAEAAAGEAWQAMLDCLGGTAGMSVEGARRLMVAALVTGDKTWPGRCMEEAKVDEAVARMSEHREALTGALENLTGSLDAFPGWIDSLHRAGRHADFRLMERETTPPIGANVTVIAGSAAACVGCEVVRWRPPAGGLLLRRGRDLWTFTADSPRVGRRATSARASFDRVYWTPGSEPMVEEDRTLYALDGRTLAAGIHDAVFTQHGLAIRRDDGAVIVDVLGPKPRKFAIPVFEFAAIAAEHVFWIDASVLYGQSVAAAGARHELGAIAPQGRGIDAWCRSGEHLAVVLRGHLIVGTGQELRIASSDDVPESAQLACRPDGVVRVLSATDRDLRQRECSLAGCAPEQRVLLPDHSLAVAGIGAGDRVALVRETGTDFRLSAFAVLQGSVRSPDSFNVIGPETPMLVADYLNRPELTPRDDGAWITMQGSADQGTHVFDVDAEGRLVAVVLEQ